MKADKTVDKPVMPMRPGRRGGLLNAGPGPGRPKGSRSFGPLITRHLCEALEANDEEQARALAKALIIHAAKGNGAAIKALLDRVDGPVQQQVDVTSGGDKVQITFGLPVVVEEESD